VNLRLIALVLPLALRLEPRPAVAPQGEGYVVVVNKSNSVSEMPRDLVARMFLRKVRRWPDGAAAMPLDQSLLSSVRVKFSREVLGFLPSQVSDYWMKHTLSGGEVAPAVRASDQQVLSVVADEPGAIAYVSASSTLPEGVKAVTVKQ
jgi:ABC-type phosphate transport system substrate-binding protein